MISVGKVKKKQGGVFACQKGIFAGTMAKSGINLAKMVITGKKWQKVFFRILLDSRLLYQYNIIQTPKNVNFFFNFISTFVCHF